MPRIGTVAEPPCPRPGPSRAVRCPAAGRRRPGTPPAGTPARSRSACCPARARWCCCLAQVASMRISAASASAAPPNMPEEHLAVQRLDLHDDVGQPAQVTVTAGMPTAMFPAHTRITWRTTGRRWRHEVFEPASALLLQPRRLAEIAAISQGARSAVRCTEGRCPCSRHAPRPYHLPSPSVSSIGSTPSLLVQRRLHAVVVRKAAPWRAVAFARPRRRAMPPSTSPPPRHRRSLTSMNCRHPLGCLVAFLGGNRRGSATDVSRQARPAPLGPGPPALDPPCPCAFAKICTAEARFTKLHRGSPLRHVGELQAADVLPGSPPVRPGSRRR